MDDKELIKRIMEEVKDEKLREELLALVVEKNRKKDDIKREEEKYIDYVAKQAILFGATEGVSKVGWWIAYIISIVFILVGSLGPLGLLVYFLTPDEKMDKDAEAGIILLSALFIIGLGMFFSLRSGKRNMKNLNAKKKIKGSPKALFQTKVQT